MKLIRFFSVWHKLITTVLFLQLIMSRSRSKIGQHFEDIICMSACVVCRKYGLHNLNNEKTNYPHVDIKCCSCNSVFQVKASCQESNLRNVKNDIYHVNMFRERIVNEALELYGDRYHIIAIKYSNDYKEKMIIERTVLSSRIRKVIKREGGVDAVEIVGSRIII